MNTKINANLLQGKYKHPHVLLKPLALTPDPHPCFLSFTLDKSPARYNANVPMFVNVYFQGNLQRGLEAILLPVDIALGDGSFAYAKCGHSGEEWERKGFLKNIYYFFERKWLILALLLARALVRPR